MGPCCDDILIHLYEYINTHDVPPDFNEEIRRHLELCRSCFGKFEFEQKLLARLKEAGGCACPETLKAKIKTIVEMY